MDGLACDMGSVFADLIESRFGWKQHSCFHGVPIQPIKYV